MSEEANLKCDPHELAHNMRLPYGATLPDASLTFQYTFFSTLEITQAFSKEGGHREEEEIQPPPKKRGRKRKADEQLVPEDVPVSDNGEGAHREREAEEERKKQLAATLRGAGKLGWEYVDRSPTQGAAVKGKRGSTRTLKLKPLDRTEANVELEFDVRGILSTVHVATGLKLQLKFGDLKLLQYLKFTRT
ncbi:hypothetical protein DFH09DRAFT_1096775 [Mycena vulgaris]|nr:hypothetical protein DFH09DRAFT_1096775 [Mycena vulgaris]